MYINWPRHIEHLIYKSEINCLLPLLLMSAIMRTIINNDFVGIVLSPQGYKFLVIKLNKLGQRQSQTPFSS